MMYFKINYFKSIYYVDISLNRENTTDREVATMILMAYMSYMLAEVRISITCNFFFVLLEYYQAINLYFVCSY